MNQTYHHIDPVTRHKQIKAIVRMQECRKFFQDYCENNPQFSDYFRMSFCVSFRFALDFLLDLDIIDQNLHSDFSNGVDFGFDGQHFKVNCFGYPELRFHVTCTFQHIVIQIINQLKIEIL